MEESSTMSQKPDGERISRRRSTETKDSEKYSKMRTKKKYVDLTIRTLLLVFNKVMRLEARLQWVEE